MDPEILRLLAFLLLVRKGGLLAHQEILAVAIALGLLALIGLIMASGAKDGMFYTVGLLFFLFGVLFIFFLIARCVGRPAED